MRKDEEMEAEERKRGDRRDFLLIVSTKKKLNSVETFHVKSYFEREGEKQNHKRERNRE